MATYQMPGSYSSSTNTHGLRPYPATGTPMMTQSGVTRSASGKSDVAHSFYDHATGLRTSTEITIYSALKQHYPDLEIVDIPASSCDILAYLQSEEGMQYGTTERILDPDLSELPRILSTTWAGNMNQTVYVPPYRRMDGGSGAILLSPVFDQFLVTYGGTKMFMFVVSCRDGNVSYGDINQFLLTSDVGPVHTLIKAAGMYYNTLHEEIWVFDNGWWNKSPDLYRSIQKSRWEDIILDSSLKEDLLKTVLQFFDKKDVYEKLRVPWKRGLIFYGPPGNGKTVSIKATMKTLQDRKDSIPTLYVKSLRSFGGPEYAIDLIFEKARLQAPCYLVFEDLDSLVSDQVRSFFLNAVDGLSENQGILMVGSTNHLDRLDPGISKRPSRFDRKYLFPLPDLKQRTAYCSFWQKKLKDNDDVQFPDKLCIAIAKLMDKFSFAYMQEAFVSTLLKIATDGMSDRDRARIFSLGRDAWEVVDLTQALTSVEDGDDSDLDKYVLYREIKIQVKSLREEFDGGKDGEEMESREA